MKYLKKFEKNDNIMTKNKSDITKKGTWSPEYYINKEKGFDPFVKKDGKFTKIDGTKTIPQNVVFMKDEDAEKLNNLIDKIKEIQDKYDDEFNKIKKYQRKTTIIKQDSLGRFEK